MLFHYYSSSYKVKTFLNLLNPNFTGQIFCVCGNKISQQPKYVATPCVIIGDFGLNGFLVPSSFCSSIMSQWNFSQEFCIFPNLKRKPMYYKKMLDWLWSHSSILQVANSAKSPLPSYARPTPQRICTNDLLLYIGQVFE